MSTAERQRRLRERLSANRQRLARQNYLCQLPSALSSYLEQCPVIQTPTFDQVVPLFWISPHGIGKSPSMPIGYTITEYSWADQAIAAALERSTASDEQASYFWPSGGNPIYEVTFGWVRQHLHELWPYSPQELGVVTTDQRAGMVLSNYCGYVPDDPNPDEIVYEVAVWNSSL
jgi:hypothetical protein